MNVFILCLLTLAVASAAVLKRQCEDSCTPGVTPTGCRHYELCVNSGCGFRCQIILPKKRALCLGAMCNVFCPFGNKISADGCPMCACNSFPIDGTADIMKI